MDRQHGKAGLKGERAILTRVLPPIAFIFALCILVICCYESGYSSLPPTEKRYSSAKAGMETLRQNEKKSMQRQPWEDLASEFKSIYDADPGWPNRPAALFRAAESLEELAKRSFSKADARKAISCYENLALRHASSRLADDALYRAARMRATWLKDDKGALALVKRLKQQYPSGDMLADAKALEKALLASAKGKPSEAAAKIARTSAKSVNDETVIEKTPPLQPSQNFSGDLPLRYKAAKSRMEALRKNSVQSCWRHPWEEIQKEFLKIRRAGQNRLAPAALYQAAVCQQAIARCSRLDKDNQKAIQYFQELAQAYPRHALADDALLEAARMQYATRNGQSIARRTIDKLLKNYPSGDMAEHAKRLLSIWDNTGKPQVIKAAENRNIPVASAKTVAQKPARQPELQVLSWDSINRNNVEITLELSSPVKFATRLEEASKGKPARLFVSLENASVVNDVRKGVTVQGSLLQAVRVKDQKGGATLQFDLRAARKVETRTEDDACRIILSVAAGKGAPAPQKATQAAKMAQKGTSVNSPAVKAVHIGNMASQLGLTVHRVFIDAGHGGRDPGTNHNSVLERAVTLEVALQLGRLLTANGLQVVYSRSTDKAIRLSERTAMANAAKADLFVSIHVNAHDKPEVSGIETYYLNLASNPQAARVAVLENAASDRHLGDMQGMLADVMLNARVDESKRLAADIQRLALFRLKKRNYATRNNGVKSAPFHVLIGAQMPAVLVELGYCTNSTEARNLANSNYRLALAEGLAEGILAYRDRLTRNRTAGKGLTTNKAGAM